MPDPQFTPNATAKQGSEYIIYTFEPSDVIPNRMQWKKQGITTNKLSAFQAGQKLFSLKKYARIELYERAIGHGPRTDHIKPIHHWQIRKNPFSIYNLFWISGIIILLASLIVFHFH